jgi:hypothetical protein
MDKIASVRSNRKRDRHEQLVNLCKAVVKNLDRRFLLATSTRTLEEVAGLFTTHPIIDTDSQAQVTQWLGAGGGLPMPGRWWKQCRAHGHWQR